MRRHLKDYFIPHEGNEYKPHSLQKAAMLAMVTLMLISFAATNLHSVLWVTSDWLVSTVLPAVIVDLTNEQRESNALNDLRHSSILDQAATLKAQDMARNQYFAHYSPSGVTPWHWFSEVDYNFVHAGENLAIHFTDSEEVVEAWMESPTHRANIVDGDYTEIGVGTAEGTYEGFKTVYVVQLFGTPAAAAPVPPPTPTPVTPPAAEPDPVPVVAGEIAAAPSEIATTSEDEVLAEAVTISETVETVPAEPVPVLTASDTATSNVQIAETTQVNEVETINDAVVVYSGHISTTTGGIPASLENNGGSTKQSNFVEMAATQPHLILQILYVVLSLFVVVSLTLAIVIEIKRQHPLQITYSVALLLLMVGLYQFHTWLGSGAMVL